MSAPYWVSPREANLLVTGGCNLSCRHCSVTSYGAIDNDLPLSVWRGILDELQRSRLIKLTLTGGEPLSRKDFTAFLGEVYKRPFRFSINTNGTLLTDEVVSVVADYRLRFNEFMVSLDGPDSATVDAQRGGGVFKSLVAGVERLRSAGLPFGFYCTVTSLNAERVVETALLAMSMGAEWIKFNDFLLAGPGLDPAMVPDQAVVNRASKQLAELARKHPGFVTGSLPDRYVMTESLFRGELKHTPDRAFSCGGGTAKIAVFPDGRVTPCDHLPDVTLGDITRQSLEEILTGAAMKRFSAFLNQKRSFNPECASCPYLDFCTGGCPVEPLGKGAEAGIDRHSCLKIAVEGI